MVLRLLAAVAVIAFAVLAARWWQQRRAADAPTQRRAALPDQIDRGDFHDPTRPWLVAVFTSQTCQTCADVVEKAQVLASDRVAVQVVSYQRDADLQARYHIDAVPSVIVADADGVVRDGAVGPITATDLWAMVAEARSPGSIDRGHCEHH